MTLQAPHTSLHAGTTSSSSTAAPAAVPQQHSSRAALPRLVQFHVLPDGFTMRCHYCAAARLVAEGDAAAQILMFQEEHFACDPSLDSAGA